LKRNKKIIGTITFHWATNYGAVLQAYALQKYLQSLDVDTEIIDYVPKRIAIIERMSWMKNFRFREFRKEQLIKDFRKNELRLSKKHYYNNRMLFELENQYDCIVVGSDQVWNYGFTMNAEKKPT